MKATTTKFSKRYLQEELDLPYGSDKCEILSDEMVDHRRWSITHKLVFRTPDMQEDTAWRVYYEVGATECQEMDPWEWEDEVEGTLVKKAEKTVIDWVPVEE